MVLGLVGSGLVAAAGISVYALSDMEAPMMDSEPAWLELKLNSTLSESPGDEGMLVDPNDLPPLRTELSAALRAAATDDSVKGLYLELGGVSMGWASMQELRDSLLAFKEAEKPCVVWAPAMTTQEYYVASACDTVALAPGGLFFVNGLATTSMYFADTFQRYGVVANFEHVGDFKSAVEPYERTGPSDAALEASNALLDSIYGQLVDGIAKGRGVEPEVVRGWIDDPPMTPGEALELKMIDKLAYVDQIREETGGEDRKKFKSYLRKRRAEWSSGSDEIAVIYAEGTIIDGNGGSDFFGGRYIGDRTLSKQLREAREDEDVKAVVLRVDSPGGSGSASDAIWREVALTREKKPVVVSMADYAASGGYYISMGATRIFAEPGTLTGSIGVFGGKLNLAGVYNQFGVVLHSNNRGEFADLLSETSNFDDSDRTKFRSFLTGFYDLFITKAAEGRGMEKEALHQVAQGRVWTGAQALERGLVDELGGLDAALAYAAKEANLTEYAIVRVPERRGFFDQLAEELNNPDAKDARLMLPGLAENLAPIVALERVLGEGNGVALLMPPGLQVE